MRRSLFTSGPAIHVHDPRSRPKRYGRERQQQVLEPKLNAQERALQSGIDPLALRGDHDALAPECMLVFELRDHSLVSFTKAISAIDGLALVGEEATETDDRQKAFLYLMVPSQSAIAKLLALWKLWIANKSLPEFDKLWELVFDCLHDLRRWGPKDRVSEPDAEIIKSLAEDDPTATVRIEIELVFERAPIKANRSRAALEAAVTAQGGRKVRASRLDAIAYDALLVDIPAAGALALAEHNPSSLAGMPDIYAIRPQSLINIRETVETGGTATPTDMSPTEPAIAAILDAVPVQNHPAFARHIDLVDPDDLQSKAVGLRTHGTAMVSLVVRGDLKRNEAPLNYKVVVRPLMFAERRDETNEVFEPEHLLVDDFVRAILDLKVTRNADRVIQRIRPVTADIASARSSRKFSRATGIARPRRRMMPMAALRSVESGRAPARTRQRSSFMLTSRT